MSLTPEERKHIYEEEKERERVRASLQLERTERLEAAIRAFQHHGFVVRARTETTAHLVKPKRWGCGVVLLGIVTFGVGFLIFALTVKEESVDLSLDKNGQLLFNGKTQEEFEGVGIVESFRRALKS